MALWEVLPIFYGSSDQVLNASDLNAIRRAAALIDGWTYRNTPVFDSSAGIETQSTPGYYSTITPWRIWWGAVRMVAGCTTLTVAGRGAQTSAESLKVYVNGSDTTGSGTLIGTITLSGSPTNFSQDFTISGQGWTDGQVIQIEIRVEGAHLSTAAYIIHDIYLSPISKASWSAAPSFATVASATNASDLNALCTALTWMYDRLRLVPWVPHLALYYNLGPFKAGDSQHTDRPIFVGSVGKYYSNAQLLIQGAVMSHTTTGWYWELLLDGSVVYTSPTYGIGMQPISRQQSLAAYTLGNRVQVSIRATASTSGTAVPLRFTHWTIGIMHAVADSSGWPYASLPTAFPMPNTTISAETVRSRLAALSTIVNDAKTRIDARPELWARSRAMRRYYSRGPNTEELQLSRARPYFKERIGNELFLKGKDLKLAFGPVSAQPDQEFNTYKYSFEHEEQVDAQEGVTVALDNYAGLDYSSVYRILGDPLIACEYIG